MWDARTSALEDNKGLESHVPTKEHCGELGPMLLETPGFGSTALHWGGSLLARPAHAISPNLSQRGRKKRIK